MRRGMSDAARCEAQRSVLQQPMQRAAMTNAPHRVSKPEELPWDEEHRKQPHAPAPASAKNTHRLSARCNRHLCIIPCQQPPRHLGILLSKYWKKETQQYCSDSRRIEAFISIRWFRTAVPLRFQRAACHACRIRLPRLIVSACSTCRSCLLCPWHQSIASWMQSHI